MHVALLLYRNKNNMATKNRIWKCPFSFSLCFLFDLRSVVCLECPFAHSASQRWICRLFQTWESIFKTTYEQACILKEAHQLSSNFGPPKHKDRNWIGGLPEVRRFERKCVNLRVFAESLFFLLLFFSFTYMTCCIDCTSEMARSSHLENVKKKICK